MSIVALSEVKQHLRYDDSESDLILELYINAAEAFIKKYLNQTDVDLSNIAIKQAALLLIGHWDADRNGGSSELPNGQHLPSAVLALLEPFRMPLVV